MKAIIFPLQNNKLGVREPYPELTIEEAISLMPEGITVGTVDLKEIDYLFLDALYFRDKKIEIRISEAKEIWLEHYRRARTPLLEKLDIDFMRAVEAGNTTLQQDIAAKKQALRDVTKTELPNTLEGIKSTWPEILGENPFKK